MLLSKLDLLKGLQVRGPHAIIIKTHKKIIKKKKKTKFVELEQVMSNPKPSKKSRSTMNYDGVSLSKPTEKENEMLLDEEMDPKSRLNQKMTYIRYKSK